MKILSREFQFEVPHSKDYVYSYLENLSGWQTNRGSWQQGRFRVFSSEQSVTEEVLSLTTSFMKIISLVQVRLYFEQSNSSDKLTVNGVAKFSSGILAILAFFIIFIIAITISDFTILAKLPFYALILFNCYFVLLGIYRDRDNLITDLGNLER